MLPLGAVDVGDRLGLPALPRSPIFIHSRLPEGLPRDALKILSDKEKKIHNASIEGDRMTLKADSFIPGTMAVIYLLILIYFRSQGGYKPVKIED